MCVCVCVCLLVSAHLSVSGPNSRAAVGSLYQLQVEQQQPQHYLLRRQLLMKLKTMRRLHLFIHIFEAVAAAETFEAIDMTVAAAVRSTNLTAAGVRN